MSYNYRRDKLASSWGRGDCKVARLDVITGEPRKGNLRQYTWSS